MLFNHITESIKKMKQLDLIENAALDAEKKAKNDSDYKALVEDYSCTMKKLQQVVSVLDFSITSETLQYMEDALEGLRNVETSGIIDSELLYDCRQLINKKVNPNLAQEWKTYYQKKTPGSMSKLNTLGHLIADEEATAALRKRIINGSDWAELLNFDEGINSRLDLYKSAISEIDEFEEKLNLSEEIKDFIVKVTSGKARVDDINENIIDWIKMENLEDRFIISFNS